MTATELAFLPTRPGAAIAAAADIMRRCLDIQDAWCAEHVPAMPRGARARGALFLQQVEDPAITLLTAHWDSVSQHHEWIASDANKNAFGSLGEHFDLHGAVFFHVADTAAFGAGGGAAAAATVQDSPLVGVTRIAVPSTKKTEFGQAYGAAEAARRGEKQAVVHGGWRVEKAAGKEDEDEFVVVEGRDSAASDEESWLEGIVGATSLETRHYRVMI
jgi:hypothetical protein